VNDMLNKENKFSSFMFADDMLISSVFMTPSTEAEHKSILNSYIEDEKSKNSKILSGDKAFKLYDIYKQNIYMVI